jgi:hypothetical protein
MYVKMLMRGTVVALRIVRSQVRRLTEGMKRLLMDPVLT